MTATTYRRALLVAVAGLPAALVSTIWLVGDQSYQGRVDGGLDYAVRPLEVSSAVVTAAGVAGLVVLLAAVLVVRRIRGARGVLVALAAAGALIGATYRVATAGVIGANIGAGLAIFFLLPLAVLLLIAAAIVAYRQRPDRERRAGGVRPVRPPV